MAPFMTGLCGNRATRRIQSTSEYPFTLRLPPKGLRSLRSEPFACSTRSPFEERRVNVQFFEDIPTSVTECDSKMLSADGRDIRPEQVFAVALSGHLRFYTPFPTA